MMPLCVLPLLLHGREENKWQILLPFGPCILTLAPASSQSGQFSPLKSRAHHNTRICIVDENIPE